MSRFNEQLAEIDRAETWGPPFGYTPEEAHARRMAIYRGETFSTGSGASPTSRPAEEIAPRLHGEARELLRQEAQLQAMVRIGRAIVAATLGVILILVALGAAHAAARYVSIDLVEKTR